MYMMLQTIMAGYKICVNITIKNEKKVKITTGGVGGEEKAFNGQVNRRRRHDVGN